MFFLFLINLCVSGRDGSFVLKSESRFRKKVYAFKVKNDCRVGNRERNSFVQKGLGNDCVVIKEDLVLKKEGGGIF